MAGSGGSGGSGGSTGSAGTSGASDGAVTTNRYDNVRSGANLGETTLTVANVGGGKFGLLFSRMVDGHVYAQPLYLPNLTIGGAKHNVVFVATEANTVFAYDADSATATTPLWMKSLGTPMRTYPGIENQPVMPPNTVSCRDMYPQTGITSTPVIDRAAGKMYVVSKNFEGNVYTQRLHVLDVLTGQEMSGSPVNITGSVPGTALDGNGTTVPFDPQRHLNRPGLLLTGGTIYIAFASHCDDEPYHGWIFAYAADTLAQKAIFCTTPNGGTSMNGSANAGLGGIWQSGMGLVADGSDIYFAAGNGAFDTTNKGAQLGISLGRLQLTSTGFKVMDWFTPSAAKSMNDQDLDYTTAPVLLPNPRVILMGGKDQYLNVFDPANLGKYNAGGDANIQKLTVSGHSHGGPVYWNGPSGPTIYLWPETAQPPRVPVHRHPDQHDGGVAVHDRLAHAPGRDAQPVGQRRGRRHRRGVGDVHVDARRHDFRTPGRRVALPGSRSLLRVRRRQPGDADLDEHGEQVARRSRNAGEVQRADRRERQGLRREPARSDVRHVVDGIREAAGLRPASLTARVARRDPGDVALSGNDRGRRSLTASGRIRKSKRGNRGQRPDGGNHDAQTYRNRLSGRGKPVRLHRGRAQDVVRARRSGALRDRRLQRNLGRRAHRRRSPGTGCSSGRRATARLPKTASSRSGTTSRRRRRRRSPSTRPASRRCGSSSAACCPASRPARRRRSSRP